MTGEVHVVWPASVADPARPSGGNAYDRRVAVELAAAGWIVKEHLVEGAWPEPDDGTAREVARVLAGLPDRALVLLDGLLGGAAGLRAAAGRLRIVLLVHLPRGDEFLPGVRVVVATSGWTARQLAGPVRVHVAVPGVDPAPVAHGTAGGGELLCVGGLAPHKGQDVLVDALAGLRSSPWRCRLVGPLDRDPAYVTDLRHRIDAAGLAGRLTFVGPLAGAALSHAYATADLLVLPSRTEAYGMVVTEALARALPVVAAEVGGVPEALGPATDGDRPGALVPSDDPAALAETLRRWLTEPPLQARWRSAAAERRSTLPSWPATAAAVAAALVEAAA